MDITKLTPEEINKRKEQFYFPDKIRQNFASITRKPTWTILNTVTQKKYNDADLIKVMQAPLTQYKSLQDVSNYLWYTSKIYQNYIYYLSTIMTFDYILFPTVISKADSNPEKMLKKFTEAARIMYITQVKYNFPLMMYRTLMNGETYWYETSDKENVIYQEVPSKYCQFVGIDSNNLWRYAVNLDEIDNTILETLPLEIQNAYTNRPKSKGGKKKNAEDNFYLVSEKGFCIMAHMEKNSHDYPYFSSMFLDLNRLENDKDYYNNYLKDQNIKLVHAKVPTDSESGLPIMDKDIVQIYHGIIKDSVPDNIAAITNPFEMTGIDIDKSQKTGINIVEVATKNVRDGAGVSETMFSANTTNGLAFSTNEDAATMYPLLYFFENLVNFRLKNEKFKATFLHVNQYNRQEWNKQLASQMATAGDLRMKYIATSLGGEIYPFLMAAQMEKIIDIDSMLPNKISAFQQSGDEPKKDVGRPKTDDPSEETDKNREQE